MVSTLLTEVESHGEYITQRGRVMVCTLLTEVESYGVYITHRGRESWCVHYSPR